MPAKPEERAMSSRMETPARTQPAASPASSRLVCLLRSRLRQLLFAAAALTVVLAVGAAAFTAWWLNSLNGLPDVGDPFDVAAFCALQTPDEENSFLLLRQALYKLAPLPELPRTAGAGGLTGGWSTAHPKLQGWVNANREALQLFVGATGKADGIAHSPRQSYSRRNDYVRPILLVRLALLEGSRRQERGDIAGAWECYRAILRTTTLFRRRGDMYERVRANGLHGLLRPALASWSADPRTTTVQLRRALDEVIASEPRAEWDAFSLKLEYLDVMQFLERPAATMDQSHWESDALRYRRIADLQVPENLGLGMVAAHRFVLREPQRSKRVARLLFANWLAHVEAPGTDAQQPAVRASLKIAEWFDVPLYPSGAGALAAARALSARELAKWLVSTRDLKLYLTAVPWPAVRSKEKSGHHDLVVALAEELYRREHGNPPPSEDALVGTYLERLPADGSAEIDYGTAFTIPDNHASSEKDGK
jgi:hypothetical protein